MTKETNCTISVERVNASPTPDFESISTSGVLPHDTPSAPQHGDSMQNDRAAEATASSRATCEAVLAAAAAKAASRAEEDAGSFFFLDQAMFEKPLSYRVAKRSFDIAFSACVIAVGLIPGAVLASFVAIDTKGFPIYTQTRMGRNRKPFTIYKFRTMVADSNDLEKYFSQSQLEEWNRERKVEDDPRITKLGGYLRRSSIDEFPQFVNTLLGDMSVIGSRAITEEELAWFGDDAAELLSMRPGITGLWQTGPRNEATFESGARQKCELEYARNASVALDARLFFKTFVALAKGAGH